MVENLNWQNHDWHGQQFKLVIPSIIPEGYTALFGSKWKSWVKSMDGVTVIAEYYQNHILTNIDQDNISEAIPITVWRVGSFLIQKKYKNVAYVVPQTWMVPHDKKQHLRFTGLCDACGGLHLHEVACPTINKL